MCDVHGCTNKKHQPTTAEFLAELHHAVAAYGCAEYALGLSQAASASLRDKRALATARALVTYQDARDALAARIAELDR